jgi:hypothetical protein
VNGLQAKKKTSDVKRWNQTSENEATYGSRKGASDETERRADESKQLELEPMLGIKLEERADRYREAVH